MVSFKNANRLFIDGNYQQALKHYRELEKIYGNHIVKYQIDKCLAEIGEIASERILICTVDFLPHIGGISVMAHELANALVDNGAKVLVVAKTGSYIPDDFECKYDLYIDKEFDKSAKSGDKGLKEDKRISVLFQRLIKKYMISRFLLLHPFYYGVGARDATKKANIGLSVYFHGYEIRSQILGNYPKNLKKLVASSPKTLRERTIYTASTADQICVNSNFTKSIFDPFTIKPSVFVTGCGIPKKYFELYSKYSRSEMLNLKREQKMKYMKDSSIAVGYIGRLVHNKNLDSILKIVKKNGNFHALIVGTGPEEENLKSISRKMGIESRVSFFGKVTEQKKWDILLAMDYVMLMSRKIDETGHVEGFGIALLEGILTGSVPVTSGTGGMTDIVRDGVNGVVCPIGDEKTQSDRLLTLFNNSAKMQKMQSEAFNDLQNKFNWNLIAKNLLIEWNM